MNFSEAKIKFDIEYRNKAALPQSIVPVDGKIRADIEIRGKDNNPNEEYYKWQFIYSLIASGLYAKDYIGCEVRFPKGNAASAPLRMDAAVFDSIDWQDHYSDYWLKKDAEDLEWLNEHLAAVIEFKKDEKDTEKVFVRQVKPAMKEKDPANAYILGIYYNAGYLYLFHRRNGVYLRYDESKNQKGDNSKAGDLSLNIPDPYSAIPSFNDLLHKINRSALLKRGCRGIDDLDIISSIQTYQLQTALSQVLRMLDSAGLVNQRGYEILVQTFALKIFDEKRNQDRPSQKLQFYIEEAERDFAELKERGIQTFINRMKSIWDEAEGDYKKILNQHAIDWKNPNHVRTVASVCDAFQDYSFVRSSKSNLYQLVFYNFANAFKRDESAQFLTPIPVIDFIVKIVNPRNGESVFDPCCGIGDFLSLSYVNSQEKEDAWRLNDANIFGVDIDENMIMLTTLNMLLNGDGESKLFYKPDKGSVFYKIDDNNPPQLVGMIPENHKDGNWDEWPDKTKLKKFNVILTNPPFGEDRAYRPTTAADKEFIQIYETWGLSGGTSIDLGVVFLENAYRCLKENGRLGIVLSNSIASINKWKEVRKWFFDRMRIVALFDLPSNVFAETGVNTSIIIAYKPSQKDLSRLKEQGYSIFVKDIERVGYEKRTSKRNVFFNPLYKIDEETFEFQLDEDGNLVLDEEFTTIIADFQDWALTQEETLQKLFIKEDGR